MSVPDMSIAIPIATQSIDEPIQGKMHTIATGMYTKREYLGAER